MPERRASSPAPGASPRTHGSGAGRLIFVASLVPLALHLARWQAGQLGADPLAASVHASGWWALTLLLATLAVTPLRRCSVWMARRLEARLGRRVSDWNALVRHRRQLGLWSFFYASVHFTLHAVLDAGSAAELLRDAAERPFVMMGLAAFGLLVPLAATSTQGAIRRLGRRWARLHALVHPAAVLAVTHAWWQTKLGHAHPWGFALALLVLLGARAWARRARVARADEPSCAQSSAAR